MDDWELDTLKYFIGTNVKYAEGMYVWESEDGNILNEDGGIRNRQLIVHGAIDHVWHEL